MSSVSQIMRELTLSAEKAISAEDQEFMILESRFLSNPGIAIEQSKTAAKKMAEHRI